METLEFDFLKSTVKHIQEDGLNFDAFAKMLCSRGDVDYLQNCLRSLYFDYTQALFLLGDINKMPPMEDITEQLYWLRAVFESLEAMAVSGGRTQLEMRPGQ